jgi:archaemetzincin
VSKVTVGGSDCTSDLPAPGRLRRALGFGAAVLCGALLVAGCQPEPPARAAVAASQPASAAAPPLGPPTRFSAEARRRRAQVFAAARDERGFVRLGEPEFGDWLTLYREPGQTVDEYVAGPISRKTAVRRRLYVQPFADLSPLHRALLPLLRAHLAAAFDAETVALPPLPAPPGIVEHGRRQVDGGRLVQQLARGLRPDALAVAGFLGTDIYEREGPRRASTFGLSAFGERAALTSLFRTGADRERALRRALKLATHETGHALGLEHCVFYRCVMNGVRTLEEVERQPLHACPVCLAKLGAALGFEPRARYARLAAFYRRHGLVAEADFAQQRAAAVR